MRKIQSQARRQRRAYELWLKENNPAAYREWKSQSVERGRGLQEDAAETVRKAEAASLENRQTNIIVSMRDAGRSEEEINEYVAIWVKTLRLWGSDEPKMSWNQAKKEYIKEIQSA
jgi:hypothetical protein